MVDAQGGLILSRVRMGGVLLFGRFVRVLRPRQLLMHSLSEALHCHDYSNSHMYSVEEIDASAAERRSTLAEEGRR
jgi:hypothetical protein